MAPLEGSAFCFVHDPRRARDRAKARKLGGKNGRTPPGRSMKVVPLRDVASIQQLLETVVADTTRQANSAQRSRTIGYLLSIGLRTLEVGEFEARLSALEQRLGTLGPVRVA